MISTTTTAQRLKRPPIVHSATHLFTLGQAVRLKGGLWPSGNTYLVTARLPPSGESPQYHIRSDTEEFERMAMQANLEPVRPKAGGEIDALIEKSFGLGPGAHSQQSRDRNAEAGNGPILTGSRVRQAE
jgi:hypothetical protein